jgi:hypothetical protein
VRRTQEFRTTEEHKKRPESKSRLPYNSIFFLNVASPSPKKTEFQTTNKRQKQRKTHTLKRKHQQRRQNRSPSLVILASNPKDDTPEQREAREHWKKSFDKVFQKCGYRTPRTDN